MKTLLAVLMIAGSMSTYAADLELQECTFRGGSVVSFTPSSALTAMLRKEVKGAVVYKVKYLKGRTQNGPKTDLAVVDQVAGKNLEVSIFEHDAKDGLIFKDYGISIDLQSPVTIDSPAIGFSSHMNGTAATAGKCFLTL